MPHCPPVALSPPLIGQETAFCALFSCFLLRFLLPVPEDNKIHFLNGSDR